MLIVTVLLWCFIHLHEFQEYAVFLQLGKLSVLSFYALDLIIGMMHESQRVLWVLRLVG
jgi:hypothetical protein